MYEYIVISSLRFFDMNDIREIERMTMKEFAFRMTAYQLKRADKAFDMHMQAWLNQQVQASKSQGSKQVPVYKRFTDFYDLEKEERKILGGERKHKVEDNKLKSLIMQANK